METRAHYVAVGAFVLAMLFLAFVAVLWLAGSQFSTSFAHYDIYFEGPVSGLSNGAKVEYIGIPVGTVSDIEIVSDPEELARAGKPIRVTIEIKSTVQIKKDAAASIQTNILSGVSFILISQGKNPELIEAHKGERYPVIRSRRSTFSSLAARGPQLLDKIDGILDQVDDVLNEQNRQNFAATLENIKKVTGSLAEHLDKSYSSPNGLKDELSAALTDFDKLVKGLGDTNHQIEATMQDVRPGIRNFSQHTLVDIDSLIGETRQFVSGLSRLASQIERDPTRLLFGDRREGYQPK